MPGDGDAGSPAAVHACSSGSVEASTFASTSVHSTPARNACGVWITRSPLRSGLPTTTSVMSTCFTVSDNGRAGTATA